MGNKNEDITALMIPCEVADYTDVFFKKNAGKLLKHEGGDHIIELNGQNPSFEFLYNLSSSELKTL